MSNTLLASRTEGAAGADTLSALERAVLETIAYSDVFDYAPTPAEIWRYLPVPATAADVASALEKGSALSPFLSVAGHVCMLSGREALNGRRRQRKTASDGLWVYARRYGRTIAGLPFVRMVAVTGALAVDNSDARDDIDFMIVTTPRRVWLTRALVVALVRFARLRGVCLCPNFLIAEDALELADRDLYTARELLQMTPLSGHLTYERLLAANAWWRELLPNATPAATQPAPRAPASLTRLLESLLGGRLGTALDRAIMRFKAPRLAKAAGGGVECRFDASMCKGHADGYRARTQAAVAERLRMLGVGAG